MMSSAFDCRSSDRALAASAVALILDGQAPPFEGRVRDRMREALWFDSAVELASAGLDYFAPVARKRIRPLGGFSKADVAETTNVVWLDLDPRAGVESDREQVLISESERNLDALRALGTTPSVFIFSGRGSWAYWKLDRHVSQVEAEALMRRLYAQFRREGSEHDIGRVARMPGSVNEKTGLQAFVMGVVADRWDPEELGELLPELEEARASLVRFDSVLRPEGRLPVVDLPDGLALYLQQRPSKEERVEQGIDGSAREQAIICRLVNKGCSDSQIALFFDHHQLPRHEEEKQKRRGDYGWLARSIAKARARLSPQGPSSAGSSSNPELPIPPLVSIGNGPYFDPWTDLAPTKPREPGWEYRRWTILTEMDEGLKKKELIDWVRERFAVERSQARRDLKWLEKKGYLDVVVGERDRRVRRLYRTQQARAQIVRKRDSLLSFSFLKDRPPLTFRKGLPAQTTTESELLDLAQDESDVSEVLGQDPDFLEHLGPDEPHELGQPLVIVDEREAWGRREDRRRQRSLINGAYRIHIPGDRSTYLQLLLPLEEWVRVRLHEQLPVATDHDGVLVYRSFISPKDPALGGEDADDPIERRTLQSSGWPARDRMIGWAAELSPPPITSIRGRAPASSRISRRSAGQPGRKPTSAAT
jgi:DNA-binding MarR family transcriptional regulator